MEDITRKGHGAKPLNEEDLVIVIASEFAVYLKLRKPQISVNNPKYFITENHSQSTISTPRSVARLLC